jgi:hypothetical protein
MWRPPNPIWWMEAAGGPLSITRETEGEPFWLSELGGGGGGGGGGERRGGRFGFPAPPPPPPPKKEATIHQSAACEF